MSLELPKKLVQIDIDPIAKNEHTKQINLLWRCKGSSRIS